MISLRRAAMAAMPALLSQMTVGAAVAQDQAFEFDASYVADTFYVPSGSASKGVDYLGDVRAQLSIDLAELAGISGGQVFLAGRALHSSDFSGAHLGEFQKVSNIDAYNVVRLYEAWYDQSFYDGLASLRAGLYDLNTEFDVTPPALLFLNASQGIGTEFGQTGENGPSIFPVTSLAARVAINSASGFSVLAAVFDGVPGDPNRPKRTTVKLGGGDGALVTGEVQYNWEGGKANVGLWTYTGRFEELVPGATGAAFSTGNRGVYASLSGVIAGAQNGAKTEAYIRAGTAADTYNPVDLYIGGGIVATGYIPGRPEDQFGVAIGHARTGDSYRRSGVLQGARVSTAETIVEATYRANILPWLTLQPDLQVILRPGFDPVRATGVVVGLRVELHPFEVH